MSEHERPAIPLREWTLRNFKSVESATLQFAPLTVLAGINSSGKSSLLQSILVISQATASDASLSLPLNGSLVELGDFADILFAGTRSDSPSKSARPTIDMSGVFDLSGGPPVGRAAPWPTSTVRIAVVHWGASFCAGSQAQLGVAQLARSELRLTNNEGDDVFSFISASMSRVTGIPSLAEVDVPSVPLKGRIKEAAGRSRISGIRQKAGIPTQFFVDKSLLTWLAVDAVDRMSARAERLRRHTPRMDDDSKREIVSDALVEALKKQVVFDFARRTQLVLSAIETSRVDPRSNPDLLDRPLGKKERNKLVRSVVEASAATIQSETGSPEASKRRTSIPLEWTSAPSPELRQRIRGRAEHVGSALVQFMASSIFYLGPLREDPHILYAVAAGDRPGNVGKKGERTIAMLHQFGSQPIECPRSDGSMLPCTLADGVSYWLREFGMAEKLDTLLKPRLGLEPHLKLADVKRRLDLTSVGVGVSQVLPVLVMGLHAPRGAVLLMEQPELHLHPALQNKLGDFLLACARNGRQLIVETHSDHLVTRLRRHIAEDKTDKLRPYIKLIFAERAEGRTVYDAVEITPFGTLQTWPAGFFDQSASESKEIVRAGVRKRKLINEEIVEP